jgi:hypothetical protein
MIQKYARDALIWAAYSQTRKIGADFLDRHAWREESVKRFLENARKLPALENGIAFLKKTYHPDADDLSIFFIMSRIFESSRLFKPSASELRETYGIDMDIAQFERFIRLLQDVGAIKKRLSKDKEYYVLCSDLQTLFEYVTKTLNEPLEYTPRIIYSESPQVREVEVEFNLHHQVSKILAQNAERRFSTKDIVKEIANNLDSKQRAMKFYQVASDENLRSKLLQGLPPVLRKLVNDSVIAKLWVGRGNVFYWSEGPEMDFAKGLRLDRDVANNVETALKAFDSKDYSGSVTTMAQAVECSLRYLGEACKVQLPVPDKEDTLSPINQSLHDARVYDRRLYSMIVSFAVQANPVRHKVEPTFD